jgi:hypothetical protein
MNIEDVLKLLRNTAGEHSPADISIYYNDEFPSRIYKEKHPNLTEEEYNYIKKNYRNPVKSLFGKALFTIKKIYKDGNFSIITEDEEAISDLTNMNLLNWFKNIYTDSTIIDPNLLLTFHVKATELKVNSDGSIAQNERLPIYPYIVSYSDIIYKDKNTLAFYIKGDYDLNIVLMNYKDGVLLYEQYNINTLKDNKNIKPTFSIPFRNLKESKFWRNGDGVKKIIDNELEVESYFAQAVPVLDDIIFNSIDRSAIEARFNFPTRWYYAESCDTCSGQGTIHEFDEHNKPCEVHCHKCQGTGKTNDFGIFRDYKLPMPRAGFDGETTLPNPAVGYVSPPQEPQKYLTERIKEDKDVAFDWLGINYSNSNAKASETALGKMIDREELYSSLDSYLRDFGVTMQWFIDIFVDLKYPEKQDLSVVLKLYSNFKTTSSAEINLMFTQLLSENAPMNVVRPLLKEYYDSIYQTEKYDIVDKYFMYKSDDMTRNLYAAGLRTAEMVVISQNIMKWVDMIELGTEESVHAQLMELAAKELGKPIITDTDTLTANIEAQGGNKLRETVGGLQGVIEIAKAVASGLYDLSAGIELISALYGVDTEEAARWLGTPQTTDAELLDLQIASKQLVESTPTSNNDSSNDDTSSDDSSNDSDYDNDFDPIIIEAKQNAKIKEGDFVKGNTSEGVVYGVVEHIMWEGGIYGTPGSKFAIESMTPTNPAMAIRIYEKDENGEWMPTAYSIGMMYLDAEIEK